MILFTSTVQQFPILLQTF